MNIALILSGGTGARLGAKIPKQYIKIEGKPIISYCIETLSKHPQIDAMQIVADKSWYKEIEKWLEAADCQRKFRGFSKPGKNRQLSIYHALEDIKAYTTDTDYIFIHDAARPLLSKRQISNCLDAAVLCDGVMPVLPMKDTVYHSINGKKVEALLNRKEIYAGQAPEVFQYGKYYAANRCLLPDKILTINGSTEPAILYGMDIMMIPGEEANFKITTKEDLKRFQKMVEKGADRG